MGGADYSILSHRVNWADQTCMDVIPEKFSSRPRHGDAELMQRKKSSSGFHSNGGETTITSCSATKQHMGNKPNPKYHQEYVFSQTQTIGNSSSQ